MTYSIKYRIICPKHKIKQDKRLLYIWIKSHFWGECSKPLKHLMDTFVPINDFSKKDWPRHQTKEKWVAVFRNLHSDNVTWKASWMSRKSIFYGCGDKLWILLLGLWGIISYTPLLVLRQFGSK